MKKITKLILLIAVVVAIAMTQQSCSTIRRIIYSNQYNNCPSNNPNYFYKLNNTKPYKVKSYKKRRY
jgi:hypothetical protein